MKWYIYVLFTITFLVTLAKVKKNNHYQYLVHHLVVLQEHYCRCYPKNLCNFCWLLIYLEVGDSDADPKKNHTCWFRYDYEIVGADSDAAPIPQKVKFAHLYG
jgi:hypothetical protein